MTSKHLIGPFVRRFLLEEVVRDRNLSPHTRKSYRDSLRLLFAFLAERHRTDPTRVTVEQVDAALVREFLSDLEERRGNSVATRNQRLAAVRSLFRFVARLAPELVDQAAQVRAIPARKAPIPVIAYLDKPEVEALLAVPDRAAVQGRRDYAVLLLMYNTGARASEAAGLSLSDLSLDGSPSAHFVGKGGRHRLCPLWPGTVGILREALGERLDGPPETPVFVGQRGLPLTRFGIYELVCRIAQKAAQTTPSLRAKRVSPHTLRPHHRSPPAPSRRRYQYDPCLAWARLSRNDQPLRCIRLGDEGARPAYMRRQRSRTAPNHPELAQRLGSNGLPLGSLGQEQDYVGGFGKQVNVCRHLRQTPNISRLPTYCESCWHQHDSHPLGNSALPRRTSTNDFLITRKSQP